MELVAGETLFEYVTRIGPMEPAHALGIAHQVALALDAAHKEHSLHRDLKPGNIMLTPLHENRLPHAKVIDFGLAKFLLEGVSSFVSLPGFMGTPGFASPEQCQELPVDIRSDLYSLGATLWFMLSGRQPFEGSALSVIQAHVQKEPDYTVLATVPEPVQALLRRLLAKSPESRPPTPLHASHEIEVALEQIGGPASSAPPPVQTAPVPQVKPPAGVHRPFVLAFAGVGLALLAAAAFWIYGDARKTPVEPASTPAPDVSPPSIPTEVTEPVSSAPPPAAEMESLADAAAPLPAEPTPVAAPGLSPAPLELPPSTVRTSPSETASTAAPANLPTSPTALAWFSPRSPMSAA
jgi:serine/threonine protein kinase